MQAGRLAVGGTQRPCQRDECGEPPRRVSGAQELCRRGLPGGARSDSAPDSYRFSALIGLHYLLVTQQRYREVQELVASPDGKRLHQDWLFLLDAVTGVGFEREAAALVRAQGSDYQRMSSKLLWLRGIWHAHRGPIADANRIAALLAARADSSGESRDSLFARIVEAHAALGSGDTTLARERLEALVPAPKPRTSPGRCGRRLASRSWSWPNCCSR